MASRQRYVIVGIVALAIIAAVPLAHLFGWVWVQLAWDDPPILSREVTLTAIIGYALAAVAGAVCLIHPAVRGLGIEVADELAKVSWPSREETGHATVVVLVTVVICAVYLGAFDAVWLWLTNLILDVEVVRPS